MASASSLGIGSASHTAPVAYTHLMPAAGDGNAAFGKIDVCEGIVGIRERQAVVVLSLIHI